MRRIIAGMVVFGAAWRAQAQAMDRPAPIEQYLMDRSAEIALARSAAPASLSHDAGVVVLGPHGYETVAPSKNGFVCIVERSWMQPFNAPVFLDPTVRLPLCLNPPAVRTHLPFTFKATALVLARLPKQAMFDSLKAAFATKALPLPENGSMCYMLSKHQEFGAGHGNASDPHLMFWYPQSDHMTWGAEASGSPVDVHEDASDGPDPVTTFIISVEKWSDGSPSTSTSSAPPG
jgi:hypothetical protein